MVWEDGSGDGLGPGKKTAVVIPSIWRCRVRRCYFGEVALHEAWLSIILDDMIPALLRQ